MCKTSNYVYIPHLANSNLKVQYKDIYEDFYSEDGYFILNEFISEDEWFTILYKEEEILQFNLKNIKDVSNDINLIRATTCLQIDKNQNGELYPINITTNFNIKDKYIVLFLELDNIKYDCPINILLTENDIVLYSSIDLIPASNNIANRFHRTYAHGIKLEYEKFCEILNGNTKHINLSVSLLTGQPICSQKINISDTKKTFNKYRKIYSNKGGINLDFKI